MRKTLFVALWLSTTAILGTAPANADPPPNYPPDLDLTASVWSVIDGANNTVTLANDVDGGLYLDFPVMPDASCQQVSQSCSTINYLYTTHVPKVISGTLVVTLKVETTGSPVFNHVEYNSPCPNPPTVRPLIWAHNNSLSDGNRWWSHDVAYILASGMVTMNIPIDPANFSGVLGEMATDDLKKWNSAINSVSSLGVTFGGGCNYGHGVFITPTGTTARFTLENYDVVGP